MSLTTIPSLYNQSFQSDEVFTANFVARHQLLNTLCRRLQANGTENDSQHQILIGTRGMGKTSLLRRLSIEINQDPQLSLYFIPLVFREEQYNVLHLRDFWQNCGEALAEWADKNGNKELAASLDEALCSEAWKDDESAADCFLDEMNALGKRAVLMVDNLDLILDALKKDEHWTLRNYLQSRGGPIIIGASTNTLSQTADRDAAFYEFFQPSYLEPLDLPETERCMRTLASGRDELGKKVVSILNSDPARLKVLHRLSGGNPRVLALTYRFLETTDAKDAMGDLERLLDEVTPYYKARIEEYQTSLQRAIIDAIALHWDPVTTGQLSEITGVLNTTLSPQLSRLRKDGLIETVETSGSYSGYQITERFLNIWYLMRHGTRRNKQRMRWLVAFLSSFYSSKDLAAIEQEAKINGSADLWTKDYAEAFAQAQQRAAYTLNKGFTPSMKSSVATGRNADEIASYLEEGMAMLVKGINFAKSGDTGAALSTFDELIRRFANRSELELQNQVAHAMFNKAIALNHSGDTTSEIANYDALIMRFVDSSETALQENVAIAMVNKGTLLGQSGDTTASIAIFDEVITRFADSSEIVLLEQVANSMFNKAIALNKSGDSAAEIASYDELVMRFADSSETTLQEIVAKALVNKGTILGQSGDVIASISTFDALIKDFINSSELTLLEYVANGMYNKAIALSQNDDTAAEIASYDELIIRFANSSEIVLQEYVSKAMANKGTALGQIGDTEGAIETFDAVITRFAGSSEMVIQEQVAKAMFNKAIDLRQSGNTAAEVASYDALIMRFADSSEIALQGPVANAMVNKGTILNQSGDTAAAIVTFDAVITRFAESSETVLLEQVANAMFNKAVALGQSSDTASEIAGYDELIVRFANNSEIELQEPVANAMLNKGTILGQSGDLVAAIATFDELITRFADSSEFSLREQVANAMFNKSIFLSISGETAEEIASYNTLIKFFVESSEMELQELVAKAMFYKAITLGQCGSIAEEIEAYEQALNLLERDDLAYAKQLRANVKIRLANKLLDNGIDDVRAELLFLQAIQDNSMLAYSNLFWLYITTGRDEEAKQTLSSIEGIPPQGGALIYSALAFVTENFGEATEHLDLALSQNLTDRVFDFTDDLERLLRLAIAKGFGERLIAWFEKNSFSERYAPIHVALLAAVRGEKMLLDSNPEVRQTASEIYSRLVGNAKSKKL